MAPHKSNSRLPDWWACLPAGRRLLHASRRVQFVRPARRSESASTIARQRPSAEDRCRRGSYTRFSSSPGVRLGEEVQGRTRPDPNPQGGGGRKPENKRKNPVRPPGGEEIQKSQSVHTL